MFLNKKVLGLIPARGGSKGIPRKNLKKLGGKPLIHYTIGEALKSKYIDRVIVSTEDEEIAETARKYGAEIPFIRPKELANDESTSLSVVLHALDQLEKEETYTPDIIVFLQPTSPFRTTKHIDEGIEGINDYDGVVAVKAIKEHPYFMYSNDDGSLTPYLKMENRPLRRQELPELYLVNPSLFIAKREYFDAVKETDPVAPLFKGKIKGVVLDEKESIDIDNHIDFLLAEQIIGANL